MRFFSISDGKNFRSDLIFFYLYQNDDTCRELREYVYVSIHITNVIFPSGFMQKQTNTSHNLWFNCYCLYYETKIYIRKEKVLWIWVELSRTHTPGPPRLDVCLFVFVRGIIFVRYSRLSHLLFFLRQENEDGEKSSSRYEICTQNKREERESGSRRESGPLECANVCNTTIL